MEEKIVRIRIHPALYKKYKVLCAELDLSIPKQTEQIIRNFVDIHEGQKKLVKIKNQENKEIK
jgi:hypothetical protein